jgi:3-deoxy-7-phosphoheptulonate synthase
MSEFTPPEPSITKVQRRMLTPSLPDLENELTARDDLRIKEIKELVPPDQLRYEFPITATAANTTSQTRSAIHRILCGIDDRLLVIVGPCSIHDPAAALEYASRLRDQRQRLSSDLLIVMRVYFEKPRTNIGWKGLINDPYLDGSFRINDGLRIARKLLLDLNNLGVPAGVEYLDVISPQYIADLVSWAAIGARTTESQVHRELASGLSCPVGFKNGTDGNVKIAIDGVRTARQPHHLLGVTKAGHSAIVSTLGNEDCHVVLRGGKEPNYDCANVEAVCEALGAVGLPQHLMIDVSHANSYKDHRRQSEVAHQVAAQVGGGDGRIIGVMSESNLKAGRQDLSPHKELVYGQSITDSCIAWEETIPLLDELAHAVRLRRLRREKQPRLAAAAHAPVE